MNLNNNQFYKPDIMWSASNIPDSVFSELQGDSNCYNIDNIFFEDIALEENNTEQLFLKLKSSSNDSLNENCGIKQIGSDNLSLESGDMFTNLPNNVSFTTNLSSLVLNSINPATIPGSSNTNSVEKNQTSKSISPPNFTTAHCWNKNTNLLPSFSKDNLSLSRNAIMAHKNRAKKKAQFLNLNTLVNKLTVENKQLIDEQKKKTVVIEELKSKVEYLTSLLAHDSELSKIVKAIALVPGVNVSKEILQPTKSNFSILTDHSYSKLVHETTSSECAASNLHVHNKEVSPGICLHVTKNNVSFEMCHDCNKSHLLNAS